MKTVLEVIQATTGFFQKHGIESPRLNIEHLLAHVLGLKRMELYLQFDRPLSDQQLEPLRDLVKRRARGEPLQHLLGTVEFHGRTFLCDRRALVPRPETEQLCELLLKEKGASFAGRVLDVGTGSGVIALTLAAGWPEAQVEAVDVSVEALAVARENGSRLGFGERVKFYESDLFGSVNGGFNLVVANLPYIATEAITELQREVQHDPRQALDGGAAGHELIARLIATAPNRLSPGGEIALEIGDSQAAVLTEHLRAAGLQSIRAVRDLEGVERFLFAVRG